MVELAIFSHIYFTFKLKTFVPAFMCNKGIIIFTSFNCSNLWFPLLRAIKIFYSCPSILQVSVGCQTWQPSTILQLPRLLEMSKRVQQGEDAHGHVLVLAVRFF